MQEQQAKPNAVDLIIGIAVGIALSLGAGAVGNLAMDAASDAWYDQLSKPDWRPPDWIFGPVWMTLYVLMGTAAGLVWGRRSSHQVAAPLALFVIQLVLNAGWTWLFFRFQAPGAALIELGILWAMILATTIAFRRVSFTAGWLMLPYLAWVTFAGALNYSVWRMNQ